MTNRFRSLFFAAVPWIAAAAAHAENWPQFRGPAGLGYSAEKNLPVKWDVKSGENIAWKTPLPAGDRQALPPSDGWFGGGGKFGIELGSVNNAAMLGTVLKLGKEYSVGVRG